MKYCTIVADPPWPYRSPRAIVGNGGRGSQNGKATDIIQVDVGCHYDVMTIEDIKSLPIRRVAASESHLYLWTTNSFMVEAHEVARAWGFEPKTIITWVKMKKGVPCEPSMKTGYWYRSATEHILFAVRGRLRLTHPSVGVSTVLFNRRLPHSVKPDSFYDLVEANSPGRYLELFARRSRPGWDCFGNQAPNSISLA